MDLAPISESSVFSLPPTTVTTPQPNKSLSTLITSPFAQFCVKSLSPLPNGLQVQRALSPGPYHNLQFSPTRPTSPAVTWKGLVSPSPGLEEKSLQPLELSRRCVQRLDFASLQTTTVRFSANALTVQISLTTESESETENAETKTERKPKRPRSPRVCQVRREGEAGLLCCNCQKSQCLKLYCDCFRAGLLCNGCNCINCHNILEYQEERKQAIDSTLDRNPSAFKPKIDTIVLESEALLRHNKGCNCKKSACLKKYCECFQSGVKCCDNCKCNGCKNREETVGKPKKRKNEGKKGRV